MDCVSCESPIKVVSGGSPGFPLPCSSLACERHKSDSRKPRVHYAFALQSEGLGERLGGKDLNQLASFRSLAPPVAISGMEVEAQGDAWSVRLKFATNFVSQSHSFQRSGSYPNGRTPPRRKCRSGFRKRRLRDAPRRTVVVFGSPGVLQDLRGGFRSRRYRRTLRSPPNSFATPLYSSCAAGSDFRGFFKLKCKDHRFATQISKTKITIGISANPA